MTRMTYVIVAALLLATPALAQTTNDPFPTPIAATDGIIKVSFVEFASIPDIAGVAARMMLLVDEPGSRRMFVNDMRGPLYSVTHGVGAAGSSRRLPWPVVGARLLARSTFVRNEVFPTRRQ